MNIVRGLLGAAALGTFFLASFSLPGGSSGGSGKVSDAGSGRVSDAGSARMGNAIILSAVGIINGARIVDGVPQIKDPETIEGGTNTDASARAAREPAERKELKQARTDRAFAWPTGEKVPVLQAYNPPESAWLAGHRGVDLALESGMPVFAAADGTVIFAGTINNRQLVSIEHASGLRTTYEPLAPSVSQGDTVKKGQIIGTLEGDHCLGSPCLHWGAKYGSEDYIDPMSLLNPVIRLLE